MLALAFAVINAHAEDSQGFFLVDDDPEGTLRDFLQEARQRNDAPIAIIPGAALRPGADARAMRDLMEALGFPVERILILPLAAKDDPETEETDESLWIRNASHPMFTQNIPALTGVWFLSGDPHELEPLVAKSTPPFTLTPFAKALKKLSDRGGLIGGLPSTEEPYALLQVLRD